MRVVLQDGIKDCGVDWRRSVRGTGLAGTMGRLAVYRAQGGRLSLLLYVGLEVDTQQLNVPKFNVAYKIHVVNRTS